MTKPSWALVEATNKGTQLALESDPQAAKTSSRSRIAANMPWRATVGTSQTLHEDSFWPPRQLAAAAAVQPSKHYSTSMQHPIRSWHLRKQPAAIARKAAYTHSEKCLYWTCMAIPNWTCTGGWSSDDGDTARNPTLQLRLRAQSRCCSTRPYFGLQTMHAACQHVYLISY
jgi:hypothetical protein